MGYVAVAKAAEIPPGTLKHADAGEHELCIVNAGGTFFAVADRCPHMSAPLSMGTLDGTTLVCPLHFSRFDLKTGKKITGPVLPVIEGIDLVPAPVTNYILRITAIMAPVQTYDLQTFPVRVQQGTVFVDVP